MRGLLAGSRAGSSGFRLDLSNPRWCAWVSGRIWVREWTLGWIFGQIWRGCWGLGCISQTHAGVRGFRPPLEPARSLFHLPVRKFGRQVYKRGLLSFSIKNMPRNIPRQFISVFFFGKLSFIPVVAL